jgi:hypothetical protein
MEDREFNEKEVSAKEREIFLEKYVEDHALPAAAEDLHTLINNEIQRVILKVYGLKF